MSRLTRLATIIVPQGPDYSQYLIYDDFNREDNATNIGSALTGQTWTVSGDMGIYDNAIRSRYLYSVKTG